MSRLVDQNKYYKFVEMLFNKQKNWSQSNEPIKELKKLGKTLKNAVGVGGTIKNGEIIIQGNLRDKIMELLKKMGHDVKRVGG